MIVSNKGNRAACIGDNDHAQHDDGNRAETGDVVLVSEGGTGG
jgi:hypothetical protein